MKESEIRNNYLKKINTSAAMDNNTPPNITFLLLLFIRTKT